MAEFKAGFIGCGNMGGALALAAAGSGGAIAVSDHHPEKTQRLLTSCGATPVSAVEAAARSRLVFLGVKPQAMEEVAAEIWETLKGRMNRGDPFAVVSMAAGLSTQAVSGMLANCPVIRIMPNTPAAVGEGVILWCAGNGVTEEDREKFLQLLRPAGLLVEWEESRFDAASAVTGCGPAFACLFLEALTEGGVRCGLPREWAARFAQQTVLGAAKLALDGRRDPAILRGEVCSPAGSTIEGVAVLEERAVRFAVMEAVTAAYRRTLELGKR